MSRGQGRAYQRHTVWWIDYSVGGRRHREPTDAATKKDALDVLRARIVEALDVVRVYAKPPGRRCRWRKRRPCYPSWMATGDSPRAVELSRARSPSRTLGAPWRFSAGGDR